MRISRKIRQRDVTDCGAACLASVAAHYELQVPVARLRQLASTDQKGTNIRGMIEAANKIGLHARGVKGPFESLFKIPVPAIAHVVQKGAIHHYVVIYTVHGKSIEIMDPADGEIHFYRHDDFKKIWSGVLILLFPGERFEKGVTAQSLARRLWMLIWPHRNVLIEALTGALLYTIIGLAGSIYIQKIVDHVLVAGNQNLLNLMSVVMLALLIISIFIGYIKSLFVLQTGQLIDAQLILGYYKHLLYLPQRFFDTMRVGEILSRINDAVKIRAFINDVSINLAVNIFIILFSFILMFTYYWKLALIVLMVIPAYIIIYLINDHLNRKVERKLMENSAELESQLVESLTSVSTIKSFGIEQDVCLRTEDKFYPLLSSIYKSGINHLFANFSTEFVSRLFTILLLWAGAGFVMDNEITPGELLSFYAIIGYFTGPVSSLIGMNKVFQNAFIAADRLFEIMDLEQENDQPGKVVLSREMVGGIEFRNIEFRYGSGLPVFKDFNLTIHKGKVIALVGESGSGKSSLINILQNLYPVNGGEVYLGNCDIRYIENKSLRRLLGVVPQKIDLFAGNLVENIALGDDMPDTAKIIAICTSLHMMDFIDKLPAGLYTYLGENGALLSGGQKQRIAIARALYGDPEVLILDEATSALDSTAEKYIQQAIKILREQNKTVILIAHRLSTVYQADKIVFLDKGKIAEEGTHEELLANRKHYYQLWKNQFPMMEEMAPGCGE